MAVVGVLLPHPAAKAKSAMAETNRGQRMRGPQMVGAAVDGPAVRRWSAHTKWRPGDDLTHGGSTRPDAPRSPGESGGTTR